MSNATPKTESQRIRNVDWEVAQAMAQKYESNATEVLTAMRLHFEAASEMTRIKAIFQAQQMFPGYVSRKGRGNMKLSA